MIKRIVLFFISFVFLIGAITWVDRAFFANYNTLQNPGFEQAKQFWTASGGTFVTSTGAPLFGLASGTWDATSTDQTLCSSSVAVSYGLGGTNGEAFIYSKSSSAYTHLFQVRDGSGNVLASTSLVNPGTLDGNNSAKTSVNFIFPAFGGSTRICVVSQANEVSIALDGAYLGTPTNIGTVAQARFAGGMEQVGSSNCHYLENSSSGASDFDDLGTDADCSNAWTVTSNGPGTISASGTTSHQLVYTNMPAGSYKFTLTGLWFKSLVTGYCLFRLSDGTNAYQPQMINTSANSELGSPNLVFNVSVSTPGTRTYKIQASDNHAGSCGWNNDNASYLNSWKVEYFPTSDLVNYTTDQSDFGRTAWTPTGSGGIGTLSANTGFYWRTGDQLCAEGFFTAGTTSAAVGGIVLPNSYSLDSNKLSKSGNTTSQEGSVVGTRRNSAATANLGGNMVTAPGTSTTVVYFAPHDSSAANQNIPSSSISSNVAASGDEMSFNFCVPISGWYTTNRAPQLVNSVLNTSTGVTRVEAAEINCDSGAAILRQHGAWVSSVGNVSSGACAVTLTTGTFSAIPYCWAQLTSAFSSAGLMTTVAASSATAVSVDCKTDAAADCTVYDFNIYCIGAK